MGLPIGDHVAVATLQVDVLIVGAGISGIGAAWRLQERLPRTTYAVVEARDAVGGTWDLFRYPGIRSDSDIYTFSYPFRPWRDDQTLATGTSIQKYLQDAAHDSGVERHIQFGTRVTSVEWSSLDARWTVNVASSVDGTRRTITCSFLHLCTGYYDYSKGYQPKFPGMEHYRGTFIHPQFWPENLDYSGKRIVVIGSGATAVTLVPELAKEAAGVTMLQRSPGYVISLPAVDPAARLLHKIVSPRVGNALIRAKNITMGQAFYQFCRRRPQAARNLLRKGLLRQLDNPEYVDRNFTPAYDPWDQRVCVVREGDLFEAIKSGTVDVVTDEVDHFTSSGISLASGTHLEADIVVSATGLVLQPTGGIKVLVDAAPVDVGSEFTYRGLMLSNVPNMTYSVGYSNASWTLRSDLTAKYLCRLLSYMDRHGIAYLVPLKPNLAEGEPVMPLKSGYVLRGEHLFPKQGQTDPWLVGQNYLLDAWSLPRANLAKGVHIVTRVQIAERRSASQVGTQ